MGEKYRMNGIGSEIIICEEATGLNAHIRIFMYHYEISLSNYNKIQSNI